MNERIAIIGGTGALGAAFAYRLSKAGYPICIGSRSVERAAQAAAALAARVARARITGATNADAAASADIIVVAVPYAHHRATLREIHDGAQSKLVIDATVPLRPPKIGRVQLPAAGAAAVEAQQLLGEAVDVVSAFQNVAAHALAGNAAVDCDVLVSGDQAHARERVLGLVQAMGMRGWHAGPLANSAAAEALTSVLIQINKHHHCLGAGIRITAAPRASATTSYAPDRLELLALKDLPLINPGANLVEMILGGCSAGRLALQDGDVLVVAQKIVSKAEGQTIAWGSIVASAEAQRIAAAVQKDPRLVEVILRESKRVVRAAPGVLIVEHRLGFVMANAGVDQSNALPNHVVLLPRDPDRSAAQIAEGIYAGSGRRVAIIVSDSIGRAWRNGTVGHALGVAGLAAVLNLRGAPDLLARALQTTEVAVADEIAAAASLLMGQAAEGKPVVIVRGFTFRAASASTGQALLRDQALDLFR